MSLILLARFPLKIANDRLGVGFDMDVLYLDILRTAGAQSA
jgi:hypothetical protein